MDSDGVTSSSQSVHQQKIGEQSILSGTKNIFRGIKCICRNFFCKKKPFDVQIARRRRRRRRLKGIHSRSDTNRTGAEGLSFYYPRLLYCLDQMLAVMSLSQHRVSSSETVRPRAPCGARCIGHAVSTGQRFA